MNESKLNDFLKELAELSQKYDIYIGGCGCCESPFLYSLNDSQARAGFLDYSETQKIYTAEV